VPAGRKSNVLRAELSPPAPPSLFSLYVPNCRVPIPFTVPVATFCYALRPCLAIHCNLVLNECQAKRRMSQVWCARGPDCSARFPLEGGPRIEENVFHCKTGPRGHPSEAPGSDAGLKPARGRGQSRGATFARAQRRWPRAGIGLCLAACALRTASRSGRRPAEHLALHPSRTSHDGETETREYHTCE